MAVYQIDAFKSFEQVKAEENEKILKVSESNMRSLFVKIHKEKEKTNAILDRLSELEEVIFQMNKRLNNMK